MMMNNNFLFQALSMMRGGGNPMGLVQQMIGQNPRMGQAMQMIQGKNQNQLRKIAENMARERGTTLEEIAKQCGLELPK